MAYTVKRMYPSGIYVDLLRPDQAEVNIRDIAWSLSMQTRFGGCCGRLYSVADHSIFVSRLVGEELMFEALMHDAHEAYFQDLVTGLKQALGEPCHKLEREWATRVRSQYNLPTDLSPAVKHADLVALATERRDLDLQDGTVWPTLLGIQPSAGAIPYYSHSDSFNVFLNIFKRFCKEALI